MSKESKSSAVTGRAYVRPTVAQVTPQVALAFTLLHW
jgi:hypothetical protein